MKIKAIFWNILISVFAAVLTVVVYTSVKNNNAFFNKENDSLSKAGLSDDTNNVHYAAMPVFTDGGITDFTVAAEKSVNAVVHVTSKYNLESNYYRNPIYELFFGNGYYNQPVMSFGSGVIISDDGYIVTNYHVVEKSEQLEVILNDRRSFTADIIGVDPNSDLALLKVKESNLPFIPFGNSDHVKVGEWVLAVGNPFNLTSTVTAGIVSAKARSISTMGEGFSPESYIQTDAAVNKGNSGGALVDLKGELIGINSAILSPSGSYTGYSFAIPANIVKKVIGDLIKYGEVQRAVLGVEIKEINKNIEEELSLDKIEGVYVASVTEKGAAELAGIKSKDIILSINNVAVNSTTELTEQMGKYRPGEKVSIIVKRDNKKKQFDVLLRNTQGNTDIVRADQYETMLGADLQRLSSNDKRRLGLDYGLVVLKLKDGALKDAGIKENFIITNIQGEKMNSVDDLRNVLSKYKSGDEIEIEGTYPGGRYIYIYKVEMMRGK
ncbi:MAG: trypsin-like peptidase domain-containing protein [Bacteroidales bacterium]